MKVTDSQGSPQAFQNKRNALIDASEDELVVFKFTSSAVTIGRNADEALVVHSDYCHQGNIPVIRTQMPHGSSGYHDSNEFRICAVVNRDSQFAFLRRPYTRRCTSAMGWQTLRGIVVNALHRLGVEARCMGNDIVVRIGREDKKIGVITVPAFEKVLMFNVHILLDWDIDTAEKAIKSKTDMRQKVKGLKELGHNISIKQMRDAFVTAWEEVFGKAVMGEVK